VLTKGTQYVSGIVVVAVTMDAHLLLHQLLEEYGISGHNSIDESVAEYIVEAMSEDTLAMEEKAEFVRDIVLELSALDDVLNMQFLHDLIQASKQLMGVSVEVRD